MHENPSVNPRSNDRGNITVEPLQKPCECGAPRSGLNLGKCYRLPWSLTDNGISWLEVTTSCNLSCEGCYRPHEKNSHKSLAKIAEELALFKRFRKSDSMSIAGGDPLVHPDIVEIVRMIKDGGWKPIVNTNGLALTPEMLRDLKEAGASGFTFHIDTTQKRRDSKATTEAEHNELRLKFARMVAEAGGMACAFNQTVSVDTLDQVPSVVAWAKQHPDIVHTVVFILFRTPHLSDDFRYFAGGREIVLESTYEKTPWGGQRLIKAIDVVAKIREADPLYEPNGYLSGSVDPDSAKWLIATRIANRKATLGYAGAKFMEVAQNANHLIQGKWLSYSTPGFLGSGRLLSLGFAPFDSGMRKVAGAYVKSVLRNPVNALRKAYLQTFTIIQPIDFLPDGSMNMCDGCPDITVHEGKFYWSCRLEEIKEYGCFVTAVPREKTVACSLENPESRIRAVRGV